MFRLKFYAATFAIIVLLTTFTQTARAGSWSWENLWSFFSSENVSVVCTTDPLVTNNSDSGAGTLRQAVIDVCAGSTITFSDAGRGTISLTTGYISIDKNLTIAGPGADALTLRSAVGAGSQNRVVNVNVGVTAVISGLTVSDGFADTGGGISNGGNLTVRNVVLSNNRGIYTGGAIENYGTLTLDRSLVTGNGRPKAYAEAQNSYVTNGGGIWSSPGSSLTITDSTVSGNNATRGGGIYAYGTSVITNSTIGDNSVINGVLYGDGLGGGLYLNSGTATLTNCTVSQNLVVATDQFRSEGGGIYNRGTLSLINTTVANNEMVNTQLTSLRGAGISNFIALGTVNARNSIIAGNKTFWVTSLGAPASSSTITQFYGTLTSQGYNLIGSNDDADIIGVTTGNIVAADPRLSPLGSYGGPTQTQALLTGSPAINAGNTATSPATDQRGAARVGTADIGAFEVNNSSNGGTFVAQLPDGFVQTPYSYTVADYSVSDGRGYINDDTFKYTYTVTGGALPNGISLSTTFSGSGYSERENVKFIGTTSQTGIFNFSVTAANLRTGFSVVTDYRLVIGDSNSTPTPTPTATPTPTPTMTPTPSPTPTPNTPPNAAADVSGVNEDATLNINAPGVLGNDTDGENNTLTAQVQTPPANAAAFSLNANGSFSYTPNANFNGTDSFTYKASDGSLSSNTATVTITVTEVNDSPTAANDSKSTNEDTALVFNASDLTANDSAGPANESAQTLTVTLVISTANTNGTVNLNNGQITYQPAANYNGAASFDYQVCDNGTTSGQSDPKCAIATVNITVNAVNDAPVANGGSITTNEDTPSSVFTLTGSDVDGDSLTFEIVTAPVKGTYSAATGIYTPNANANGSDSFTFIARDAVSQSPAATVSITITSVNDAPTAANQSVTTDEDTAKNITLSGGDVDGDALTYSASQPSHGSVSCTGANCIYTPTANYNGADSFAFKTNDGQTDSAAATVSITVTAVNDNPDAINDSATFAEDSGANTISVRANDSIAPDTGETLTVSSVTNGANGAVVITNGGADVSYTPAANYFGADSFTYTISDGNGGSDTATVNVTVTSVNDNPTAGNDSATVPEDSGISAVGVLGNDGIAPDTGETLIITAVTQGANGAAAVTNSGAGASYTPNANFYGADSFTYTISDGNGGTASGTVNVTVTAVNDAPTIGSGTISRQQNAVGANSLIAAVLDIDDAKSNLVVKVNNAASATVNGVTISNIAVSSTGNVTADVAAACGAANATFTLKVTDPGNLSATAVFNVTVTLETTPPVIAPISNVTVYLPVGSTATSRIVSFPMPTATDNCGTVTVTTNPASGSSFPLGATIVTVTATDSSGNIATSSFTVTVLYNFTGFFQPVDNLPIVNIITAGQAVSVKFSLSGNQGLNVVAAGYPVSTPVACDATEPGSTIDETINAGGSILTFSSTTDQYSYVWKTNKAWKGTCRMFVLKLADGSDHSAKFRFR